MNESEYYENPSHWELSGYQTEEQTRRYVEAIQQIPPDVRSVLDAGCGNGMFLKHLQDQGRFDCKGLERSKAAIRTGVEQLGVNIVEGDLGRLPFEDNSFDMVTSMEVLEHLPLPVFTKAIREMERVTRRYILVNVPLEEKRPFNKCPSCGCIFPHCYHMRTFSEQGLGGLFPNCKMVKSLRTFAGRQPLLIYAWNCFRNKISPPFPPLAHCPLCGYVRETVADGGGSSFQTGASLKSSIMRLKMLQWPKIKVSEEIICLYEKSGLRAGRNRYSDSDGKQG